MAYRVLGDHEGSIRELRIAESLGPGCAETQYELALTLDQASRDRDSERGSLTEARTMEAAVNALRKAAQLAPSAAVYHHALGEMLRELGDTDEARAALEKALVLWPGVASWHAALGQVYDEQGRLEAALEQYLRAVELASQRPGYLHLAGLTYTRVGNDEQAAELLERAVRLEPNSPVLLSDLGDVYYRQGLCGDPQRFMRAQEMYQRAAELDPEDPVHLLDLGNVAIELGETEEALSKFNRAIERRRGYTLAYERLGALFEREQLWGKALEAYREASALSPDSPAYRYKVGAIHRQLDQYEEAAENLEVAVELQSDNGAAGALSFSRDGAYGQLGDVYQVQQRYDEALQAYEQALVLAPDKAAHHARVGRLCRDLGYLDKALLHIHRMVELEPEDPVAYYELGKTHATREELDDALLAYVEASERDPEVAEYHYCAGVTYKNLKRYPEAAARLRRAIKLKPNHADAYKQWAAVSAMSFIWRERRDG
jgi:tetratricopeptide (TPR) repeat protein